MVKNIQGTNINVYIEDKKFKLPEEIQAKINDFWEKAVVETPGIWNGELMCVEKCVKQGNDLVITCNKTNYSHYLYDERIVLPKEYACSSLVAGCLLETRDNYYIVGELADNTSFPHCMQVSGGSADDDDIKDGQIDIFNTIIRECKEELNIDLQDQNQVENYGIKYICLPSDKVHTYILFAKGKLKMTKEQMSKYYEEYLKYLKENNLEIEFGKIHFIKKGKTTEELEKIKNPKRNYIVDLLEIDSNDEN